MEDIIMIDFNKAMKSFNLYLKDYDIKNPMIALKVKHTYAVVQASEYIARNLNLSNEDIDLAKLIALLHDIARFEQAKIYGDYKDFKTIDHGDLAIKILFDDKLIRNFIEVDIYDDIISKAIQNHNKLNIEDGLTDKQLLHSKIIRDGDKMDIFRVKTTDSFEAILNATKEELENDTITKKIYDDFMHNQVIVSHERKTTLDCWVSYLAFIYDFNFKVGLQFIKDHDYINKMIDRLDYKNKEISFLMENIRKHAHNYINTILN